LEPILEWLRLGGGLCVVTTAARRSIHQVWDCVPPELRSGGRVVLSALEGADFVYGGDDGEMVADEEYLATAAVGGGPTCFSGAVLSTILQYSETMIRDIYADMAKDRSILAALSGKYQRPVARLLDRLDAGEHVEALLTRSMMTDAGAIMFETNERTISFNTPILAERLESADVEDAIGGTPARVCTISVMGFPIKHSKKYVDPYLEPAAAIGVELSAAPNSLWFTPRGVSKATPISWLARHADKFGFDVRHAVAFGDCPHTNDFPLTQLSLQYADVAGCTGGAPNGGPEGGCGFCPFVSVAEEQNVHLLPEHVRGMHVGGVEHGTARVLRGLLDAVKSHPGPAPAPAASLLPAVVRSCQQVLAAPE